MIMGGPFALNSKTTKCGSFYSENGNFQQIQRNQGIVRGIFMRRTNNSTD